MPIFLLNSLFLVIDLALEISGLLMLVRDDLPGSSILSALLLHISACALIGLVLPRTINSFNNVFTPITFIFFFSIAFFIPALGVLGLVFAVIPGLRPIKTTTISPIHFNSIRAFSELPASFSADHESRSISLENLLCSQNPEKRLHAVYATLKLDDKSAIPLLRMALRDSVDDIRLLAYALIDRKEQRISERIECARQRLTPSLSANSQYLYRCIVKDYWELAHLGLVEGETLNYVLDKACEYAQLGLQHFPNDRGLHLQYAKLLLRLKKTNQAYDEFKSAETLGVDRKKLLLYYAEIGFLQRRYSEVKRYMKELNLITASPQIHGATRFWREQAVADG